MPFQSHGCSPKRQGWVHLCSVDEVIGDAKMPEWGQAAYVAAAVDLPGPFHAPLTSQVVSSTTRSRSLRWP